MEVLIPGLQEFSGADEETKLADRYRFRKWKDAGLNVKRGAVTPLYLSLPPRIERVPENGNGGSVSGP